MNRTIDALRAGLARKPAPDVADGLKRRLKAMERQLATVARMGGGLGSAEVENLSRDVRQMVQQARQPERARPVENAGVLAAYQHIFDAEGALSLARTSLRERLHEVETDPTGQILATLQTSRQIIEAAEAIVGGRMPS